uniref:Uncharacterized protein n=1 Tax=Strigops habroptila TaxID=2489341 RepID=A0A672ULU4_STRHB
MLNRIIRFQAVVEIITNQTARALELIAKQLSQTRTMVYQNRLALDYLLAEEGGVCGKFNTSECCLAIDDNGQAITKIAEEIKRIAHVPVQRWNSLLDDNWWNNLFGDAWWKKAGFIIACSLLGLLFLSCMIPCLIRLIHSVVQGMQITAMPLDPEKATKGKTHSLMVLKTKKTPILEAKTQINELHKNKGGNCEIHKNDLCQQFKNPCKHCTLCNYCTMCGEHWESCLCNFDGGVKEAEE